MKTKVFFIPKNHEYINRMKCALEDLDVEVLTLRPFHWSSFGNIYNILKYSKEGYKIIHVHWLYIFPLSIIMKSIYYFLRYLDIKIIWEMHNILPHGYKEKDKAISRWFYERVDAIIYHSREDVARAKILLDITLDKKHIIIPHGHFNESYANNLSRTRARDILDIPHHYRVILCFGFIKKNRGYEYLVEATKDMKDTLILIVGRILHKSTYRKLLEYRATNPNIVLFPKWIPDEEVQIYFNACDVVVLPYTDITTSGVIPLAYSFKKPVITSAIGGIKDVVNKRTGILVPPRNSTALRSAIQDIFQKDLFTMGDEAYIHAQREFNWISIAQNIKNLYFSLLNQQPTVTS